MPNPEHLAKLMEGIEAWNQWRELNPRTKPDLGEADLWGAKLSGANLFKGKLSGADLRRADLSKLELSEADLTMANLVETNLEGACDGLFRVWSLGLERKAGRGNPIELGGHVLWRTRDSGR